MVKTAWEAFGKAQGAIANDPEFVKLMADSASIGELRGRNIAVGVDL
jgi:hypothetical protein